MLPRCNGGYNENMFYFVVNIVYADGMAQLCAWTSVGMMCILCGWWRQVCFGEVGFTNFTDNASNQRISNTGIAVVIEE